MKKVKREDVLDYQTYSEKRDEIRRGVMAIKEVRRLHVGPNLTFLFENKHTTLYQVQEMMRAEQIVKEADIQHEIETYNALLGDAGELGCTLLIEITNEADRAKYLREWMGLEKHLYLKTDDGEKIYATYDAKQVGEDRLSSVQYLKFKVGDKVPTSIGCDFPAYSHETELSDPQLAALTEDLKS
jgi:Protein of unknown function (DUF3501).